MSPDRETPNPSLEDTKPNPNIQRTTQAEGSETAGEKDVKVGHTPGQAEGEDEETEGDE